MSSLSHRRGLRLWMNGPGGGVSRLLVGRKVLVFLWQVVFKGLCGCGGGDWNCGCSGVQDGIVVGQSGCCGCVRLGQFDCILLVWWLLRNLRKGGLSAARCPIFEVSDIGRVFTSLQQRNPSSPSPFKLVHASSRCLTLTQSVDRIVFDNSHHYYYCVRGPESVFSFST